MKKSFSARRVPRIIRDDDEDDSNAANPIVVKPATTKGSLRKGTTAKTKFAGQVTTGDDNEEKVIGAAAAIPSTSTRRAIKPLRHVHVHRPNSDEETGNQTSSGYTDEHMRELRSATFSKTTTTEAPPRKKVDVAAKFGAAAAAGEEDMLSLIHGGSSLQILSEAEIRERKARRARLAMEAKQRDQLAEAVAGNHDMGEGFIFLDESGRHPDEEPEKRLVREDEDIAEGFDEYVEDGQIAIGARQERELMGKRRAEMASMIEEAQAESSSEDEFDHEQLRYGGSDRHRAMITRGRYDDDDDEEPYSHYTERTSSKRYDEAQIRAGNFAASVSLHKPLPVGVGKSVFGTGAMTPPHISEIPDLNGVLGRLREVRAKLEAEQGARMERIQELEREKTEVDESERWLQKMLADTGKEYELRRREVDAEKGVTVEPSEGPRDEPREGGRAEPGLDMDVDADVQVNGGSEPEDAGATDLDGQKYGDVSNARSGSDTGYLPGRSERELTDYDSELSQTRSGLGLGAGAVAVDHSDSEPRSNSSITGDANLDDYPPSLAFRNNRSDWGDGDDRRATEDEEAGGQDQSQQTQQPKRGSNSLLGKRSAFVSGGRMPATGPDLGTE